ncbi:hypothetical protein SDC9_132654 [bioreactor metagenome]|uniref:Uncharacterized protein n=1 Tax=bioreactor metagenome TaxID=1076179 RepID=A0A645D9G0_9ZZZZ
MDEKILEFTVFCIDSLAEYLGKDTKEVYKLIKSDSNILEDYIIPCYEPLHSQSKKYIVEELVNVLKERGVI